MDGDGVGEGKVKLGRKPDYRLKAMDKRTGEKTALGCGAAWWNEDGSISIDIDPFIVLHGGADLVLTLFPLEKITPLNRLTEKAK